MSGDILQTPDAPKPQGALDNYFKITARGSTVRQEVLAGLTTFLAMVYSVIVVPGNAISVNSGKRGQPALNLAQHRRCSCLLKENSGESASSVLLPAVRILSERNLRAERRGESIRLPNHPRKMRPVRQ